MRKAIVTGVISCVLPLGICSTVMAKGAYQSPALRDYLVTYNIYSPEMNRTTNDIINQITDLRNGVIDGNTFVMSMNSDARILSNSLTEFESASVESKPIARVNNLMCAAIRGTYNAVLSIRNLDIQHGTNRQAAVIIKRFIANNNKMIQVAKQLDKMR